LHIRERHAGGVEGLSLRPGIGLLRRTLRFLSRIGQREDDRSFIEAAQRLDHLRAEQASLGADADDRRRLEGLDCRDNFGELSRQITRVEWFAGRKLLYPWLLVRSETGTTFDNESLGIKQRDSAAGLGL